MADILRDTDLIMVNRGATNYKLTGAELKQHDRLQDTDLVMVQESGQLYSVSIGTLKTSAGSLIDGPTNYFLAERDNQLFSVENPFRRVTLPTFACAIDTSGLSSGNTNAFKVAVTGASASQATARLTFLKVTQTLIKLPRSSSSANSPASDLMSPKGSQLSLGLVAQMVGIECSQLRLLTWASGCSNSAAS